MSERERCGRPRLVDDQPCQHPLPCPWHADGVTAADRSDLARRGGLTRMRVLPATTPKPEITTPKGLRHELRELIHAVKTGTLGPEPARVAILGLGVAVKISELELHGMISDLEERLTERQGRRLA